MPDMVKSSGWRRKKNHDGHTSGSQRLLTGPEMAEEDAVKREKRELAQSRERTKDIQRQARQREKKHAQALSMADSKNDKENNQRPYQSSATGIDIGISVATSSSLSAMEPSCPPPPSAIPYQYSRETQALLDSIRARELSSRQSDPDKDRDKRERTPPVVDDPDSTEEAIMEIERQRLVDSGGTAPPLWSVIPEFAGMTRAARPGRERSERERERERERPPPPPPPRPPAIPTPSFSFFTAIPTRTSFAAAAVSRRPPPPPPPPSQVRVRGYGDGLSPPPPPPLDEEEEKEDEDEDEEENEPAEDELPPASTAPAALPTTAPTTYSSRSRKRAPTMKALEAEGAPKRGTGARRTGA